MCASRRSSNASLYVPFAILSRLLLTVETSHYSVNVDEKPKTKIKDVVVGRQTYVQVEECSGLMVERMSVDERLGAHERIAGLSYVAYLDVRYLFYCCRNVVRRINEYF